MILILLFSILLIIDQYSKYIVDKNFHLGESIEIIEGIFNFTYVRNEGVAFGMFQGRLNAINIVTIVVVIGIIVYLVKNFTKIRLAEKIAYTFILSGAFGNIIDRLLRGYVIDMLDFRGIWTYVFNPADMWINIGVIIILVDTIISEVKAKNRRK